MVSRAEIGREAQGDSAHHSVRLVARWAVHCARTHQWTSLHSLQSMRFASIAFHDGFFMKESNHFDAQGGEEKVRIDRQGVGAPVWSLDWKIRK